MHFLLGKDDSALKFSERKSEITALQMKEYLHSEALVFAECDQGTGIVHRLYQFNVHPILRGGEALKLDRVEELVISGVHVRANVCDNRRLERKVRKPSG